MDFPEIENVENEWLSDAKIMVMGVGGGGTNALNYMIQKGITGVITVAANTDAQHLEQSSAELKLHLGKNTSRGHGAGADPQKGRKAAEESIDEIRELLAGVDILILSAGMGGGTGTGATPVIAGVAKDMGILTIAIVTKPFKAEGPAKMRKANKGIEELRDKVDSLIVISNDKLLKEKSNRRVGITHMFALADEILYKTVKAFVDIIRKPGYINVDLEDVRAVLQESGQAIIGEGVGRGEHRAAEAVKKAIYNPLLELESGRSVVRGARKILVNIETSDNEEYELTGEELELVMSTIMQEVAGGSAPIHEPEMIIGISKSYELEDEVRVIVIASGMSDRRKHSRSPRKDIHKFDETKGKPIIGREEEEDREWQA